MKNDQRTILICAAWPYANGSLHLGHIASLLGADIAARYHRQKQDDVLFVSGSDCHGTPIAVEAMKQNKRPEEIANYYHNEFKKSLIEGLHFSYDLYGKTSDEFHKKEVQKIFLDLYKKGYLYEKSEELPFCAVCNKFLPDRYIEGECPLCGFDSARGDQCDNCGKLMDVKLLKNAKCKICNNEPGWRESKHFFFKLSALQDKLLKYVQNNSQSWRINAVNFTLNYLKEGLHDRAITRDTDWGVEIPLSGYENKKIYVWFEAVCGYLTASKKWAESIGDPDAWKKFWEMDSWSYYVHGKDNIPFHTIIWPAILLAHGGLNLPNQIVSSEYLKLEDKQFSKSRKWAVWIPVFLSKFNADSLRYYLIIAGPENSDSSFSWLEFQSRNNAELIGAFGNFVNRVFSFIEKNYDGKVNAEDLDFDKNSLFVKIKESYDIIGNLIEEGKYRQAIQYFMKLVYLANQDINDAAPWKKIKEGREKEAERDLYRYLHVINNFRILIAPFLPEAAQKISEVLQESDLNWVFTDKIKNVAIKDVKPLFRKIEDQEIESELIELNK